MSLEADGSGAGDSVTTEGAFGAACTEERRAPDDAVFRVALLASGVRLAGGTAATAEAAGDEVTAAEATPDAMAADGSSSLTNKGATAEDAI